MLNRRNFFKSIGAIGVSAFLKPTQKVFAKATSSFQYFNIHDFIRTHPEAVFIKKTAIQDISDSSSRKNAGFSLAQNIFIPSASAGISINNKIAIKPNLVPLNCWHSQEKEKYLGANTDPYFVEGVIEALKNMGVMGKNIHLIEVNGSDQFDEKGYTQMASRTGTILKSVDYHWGHHPQDTEISWTDCPQGIVFKRIPYLAPVNQLNTFLLNIAKFKAHGMGLSLCCKNLQGTVALGYCNFCDDLHQFHDYDQATLNNFQENLEKRVKEIYARHKKILPRWDKTYGWGGLDGQRMEVWAQRTCDSLSVLRDGFSMIEGIVAQDGDGFCRGSKEGRPLRVMSNVILFGMNKFRLDIIGHWLGSHEPGNFGFFHIAKERGLLDSFNPNEIPVYLWENEGPVLTPLSSLERYPIKTEYLAIDYNGQKEPEWHFVNEPYRYEYKKTKLYVKPEAFILTSNGSNPFTSIIQIEYRIPQSSQVQMEIFDSKGKKKAVLVDGFRQGGAHLAIWDAKKQFPGEYFFSFVLPNFKQKGKITIRE